MYPGYLQAYREWEAILAQAPALEEMRYELGGPGSRAPEGEFPVALGHLFTRDWTLPENPQVPGSDARSFKVGDRIQFVAKLRGPIDVLHHFVHVDDQGEVIREFDVPESLLVQLKSVLEPEIERFRYLRRPGDVASG